MYDGILHDDLLIAVLTFQNPNVYYELAIAHAAARPLIILCEASHALPFDIKDQRVIFYDLRPRSLFEGTYKKELEKAILQLERPGLSTGCRSARISRRSVDLAKASAYSSASPIRCRQAHSRSSSSARPSAPCGFRDLASFARPISGRSACAQGDRRARGSLIMDEQNPALTSMLNADMKNHTLKVRDEIMRSFEMWTDVGRTMPRLTVRKVRQGIVYQQLFMKEGRMIYTPYNMSTTTYYSATRHEFDFLWDRSGDGGTAQDRRATKPKRKGRAAKRSR
jgi:hypothetical protein